MIMKKNIETLHPCLGGQLNNARIHLPVSPVCNIKCKYCKRAIDNYSDRPGVSGGIIGVDEVEDIMTRALEICPQITVAGISGPADPLATNHAIDAFEIIDKNFPDIVKCLSTNGLCLYNRIEDIVRVNVDAITVTVNAVDPEIEARINKGICIKGKWIYSLDAAKILINRQLMGIKAAAQAGIFVKINTVLIPGINDKHIGKVAKKVASLGAKVFNVIGLIPQADMSGIREPGCDAIDKARQEASSYMKVFSHCARCRADAVGMIGKDDLRYEIYGDMNIDYENFSHG